MLKIKRLLIIVSTLGFGLFFTMPAIVSADPVQNYLNNQSSSTNQSNLPSPEQTSTQLKKNPIIRDLNGIVNFLGGLVGIVVIANIIIGGIQYSSAGGNQQAAVNARKRIANSLIALVAFMLIWAFVQYLVPGGVFG